MKRWEFERAVLASDLPAPARLILLTLAVIADWPGGTVPARWSPSLTTLAEMTGLSRRAVASHLASIEAAAGQDGWVVRVRPTVERARATKDRTQYRLVVPASARHALASAPGAPELVHQVHQASAGDALASAPGAHKPDLSQTSQAKPDPRTRACAGSAEQIIIDTTGASPDEARAITSRIRNERNPRSLPGLIRRMASDGDLHDLLAEHRGAIRRTQIADTIAELRKGPTCDHGVPGGKAHHPVSGEPLCPQCRFRARIPAAQPA